MSCKYDYYTEEDWNKEFEHCGNPVESENVQLRRLLITANAILDQMLKQKNIGHLVIDIGRLNNFFIESSEILND